MPTLFYEDLRNIIQYVYTGYVYIAANSLDSFLTAARCLQLLQDKEVSVVVEPDQVTQEDQEDILRDSHMEEGQPRLPEPGRHQDKAMEEVEVEEVILRAKHKWIPKLLSGLTL